MRKIPLYTIFVVCAALSACWGSRNIPCPFGPENLDSSAQDVTFTIENQACTSVCQVFLGAPSCDDWGITLLGEEVLPHGASVSYQVPPGKYDLLIVVCQEVSYQLPDLDLTEGGSWTFGLEDAEDGQACPASLTVVNNSPEPICHMWLGSPKIGSFGYNWLGTGSIPVGESMFFTVLPGSYDVKAETCAFDQLRVDFDYPISGHQTYEVP